MTDRHLITDELLLSYAAGAVEEPVAVLVATHLALNPVARGQYRQLEALGGAMIEEIEPAPLGAGALDAVLARLGDDAPIEAPVPAKHAEAADGGATCFIPRPLRDYVGDDPARLDWKPVMRGVVAADLALGAAVDGGFVARLMKIEAGRSVPQHSHRGDELVLVLDGGFTDLNGHFVRGDVSVGDESLDHRPVADPGNDCLCLIVSDGSVRLTGPMGWLANRFVRF